MTLSKYKNEIFGLIGIAFIASLIFFLNTHRVLGNPGYFAPLAQTSPATTTPVFISIGTATTTIVYDSYSKNGSGQGGQGQYNPDTTDSATLALQFAATSTSSVLGWRFEYADSGSVDCFMNPAGCDWYSDNLVASPATSTPNINTTNPNSYTWQFASSTSMCDSTASIATNNRGCKLINVSTPTRYVRVVLYTSGANGTVWGKFIPKKQQSQ